MRSSKFFYILSVVMFGTIGLVRRLIPWPSGFLAMSRGFLGVLVLLLILLIKRQKPDWQAIRKNLWMLLVSGVFIGFNWMLLFEAFNFTTVAVASLCYYMAPLLIILAAPFVLHEKMTLKKGICIAVAFMGMLFVSGVFESGVSGSVIGIVMGLGAAVLYASIMLLNKKMRDISPYDRTIVQLFMSGVSMLPYTLLAEKGASLTVSGWQIGLIVLLGMFHTGICYALFFGATAYMSASSVALLGYLDPVVSVLLSVIVLQEPLSVLGWIGAVLIIGAACVSELPLLTKKA